MLQALDPLRRADQATGAADVDFAFLGDRLGIVTKDGEMIMPDRQIMLIAADILKRQRAPRSSDV